MDQVCERGPGELNACDGHALVLAIEREVVHELFDRSGARHTHKDTLQDPSQSMCRVG